MMNGKTGMVMLALTVGILSGCGAARPSKYYQLTVPGDAAPETVQDAYPVTVIMGSLMASHLYREDRIVYSSGGEQMGTYEHERWAEPPTEMMEDMIVRELRASGRYRAVYLQRSSAHGDFLLRGHLYDFKEVSRGTLVARVTVDLELRELKSGTTVWTHFYTHDEPVSGKDVSAVVAALNRNVQRGVSEARTSLNQYFAAHPGK
jgi:ABC-type uncharacterized transport system auxiliary subunit